MSKAMSVIHLVLSGESTLVLLRWFIVLAIVLLILVQLVIVPLFYGRLYHIPGPWLNKITNFHLAFYDLQYRRNDKIHEWHKKYGPVVCIAPNEVSVSTIDATRDIYGSTSRWAKSDYFDHFMGFDERSVFATKSYAEHRERRKLISTFYQATTIYKSPEIEEQIHDRVRAVLNTIDLETSVDVYSLTDWYALDNITHLILGPSQSTRSIEFDGSEREVFKGLKQLQFFGPLRIRYPWLFKVLSLGLTSLSTKFSFLLADDRLSDWCAGKISAAMNHDATLKSNCLLQRLLRHHEITGCEPLDPNYIAAEVLDNINAAEATVAVTATYLVWRLTQNPQWQYRIRDELRALPLNNNGSLSFSDVDQCPILEACLREVYRLHPASSGRAERIVPRGGHILSGVYIPEDVIATTSVVALHRDMNVYPSTNDFAPEMWLVNDESTVKQREAQLIPFGYGGRICLGKALATMEIKVLVAEIYLRYQTYMTRSTTPESMKQCSTHDAVPRAVECIVEFRSVDSTKS